MANQEILQTLGSLEASADLSASQFHFVDVNTSGQIALPTGAGAQAIGVLLNKPEAQGESAEVAVGGAPKVTAGGAVTAGDKLQADAAGAAIVAATGDTVVAIALESAADGDVFMVLLVAQPVLA